ncbi:MAG TPA: NAD-dependent epimerase/dehydratase family protein [Gemmataceae bacterium]|nr:NAD-dependent epimerase/dehydratase family protein [Gemmataceae bacterium]
MQPDPGFWAGKRVCVTGGTGFLGWHIVRQLLPIAGHVRVLGLAPASKALAKRLAGLDCIFADVRDADAVQAGLRDCDVVMHAAGPVAVWGRGLSEMLAIHVDGTNRVLAALPPGARLVHTSSVVTVGASQQHEILTETSRFNLQQLRVDYVHAKRQSEEIALEASQRGADVVVVNPGFLLGPEDEASVMGRFCLRFWRGHMPMIPPGGLNIVDVRDVARGHLLAAEHGRRGSRYILGGANYTMRDFVACLSSIDPFTPPPRLSLPASVQSALAYLAEARAVVVRREPYPSLQHARLSRFCWWYSSERAHAELGWSARTLPESLADTYRWFVEAGRLRRPVAVG